MTLKRIVCLANSRKHAGRCVAGREWLGQGGAVGKWIRPISARPTHEISLSEQAYHDGSQPGLGDIVEFRVRGATPHENQTENWTLDPDYRWVKVGNISWDEVRSYAEAPPRIWSNGDSTYDGLNDQIEHSQAALLFRSIGMVHVGDLELHVFFTGAAFGNPKKRVQARFTYRGERYWLWVTDPLIESEYLQRPIGSYAYGECCVTVSLSEPHSKNNGDKYVYKLVAAVIPPA